MNDESLNELLQQLNCVSRLATLENAPKTQELVKHIADSLRYKKTRKNQILTIREEMKAVENIKKIFKWRLGENLIFHTDIESSCLDYYIPHFTIMAFVQNSLSNALNQREEDWIIKISIKILDNYVYIDFMDNGSNEYSEGFETCENCIEEYGSIQDTWKRIKLYNRKIYGDDFKSVLSKDSALIIKIAL